MKTRLACLCVLFLLTACAGREKPGEEEIDLRPVSFSDLSGWESDTQSDILPAFLKSCDVFDKKDSENELGIPQAGRAGDWQTICQKVEETPLQTDAQVRRFFENNFVPYRVRNVKRGLFTGYYEASLKGSRHRHGAFQTPLWQRPSDMLTLRLEAFNPEWKGRKLTGKIAGSEFVPYDSRAQIARGSLVGRATPLLWVDDPIGAFFLEIQGSGRVEMEDGSVVRVGYEAQNGQGYTAVGRVLADRGEIKRPVTMQKIRAWMETHPGQAQSVMDTNPSVIFFKENNGVGSIGAQGVALTPYRSLAVDRRYVPLGVPLWLQTKEQRRLVMAQDTGGAIKGPVRGDLFCGAGKEAEAMAGHMQEEGTYYLLLPKERENP
ncbi:MAG: murein transglycosylase A [Bdellovibrionales bacterium]